MTASRRINARLSVAVAAKVATLQRRTRKSTSAVVVEAIERYYAATEPAGADPAQILEQTGFVGAEAGPRDLSNRYKDHLLAGLRKKT
jgi:predicted transcriptional regulator